MCISFLMNMTSTVNKLQKLCTSSGNNQRSLKEIRGPVFNTDILELDSHVSHHMSDPPFSCSIPGPAVRPWNLHTLMAAASQLLKISRPTCQPRLSPVPRATKYLKPLSFQPSILVPYLNLSPGGVTWATFSVPPTEQLRRLQGHVCISWSHYTRVAQTISGSQHCTRVFSVPLVSLPSPVSHLPIHF